MNMVSFLDLISQFCIMLFVFTSLSLSLSVSAIFLNDNNIAHEIESKTKT